MKATSSTPRARALAAGLREVREAHGLGLRELARILGFTPQLLSLWEKGLRLPSVADVALILGFFQVRGAKQKHLLELAGSAREPDWVTSEMTSPAQFEKGLSRLTNWATGIVPALVQTPGYARASFERSGLTIDQVDAHVVARLNRQKILTGPDPVELRVIIDERVLTDVVGGESIMSDQMDHLLEVSRLPHVSLRLLAPTPDYHPGRAGPFAVLEYESAAPLVLLEHYRCSVFVSGPGKVDAFRRLARSLTDAAMSEESSRERIAGAAR